MLTRLFIQNYALIDQLSISFEPGFSVITGETGAGKSILLGAISLLLGNRAEAKVVKVGASKCVVEACFNITNSNVHKLLEEADIDREDDECIIRRELSATGKSRAFINDTPASLSQLKSLSGQLLDIHSQHQNLLLQNENFQLSVLNILADNKTTVKEYTETYKVLQKNRKELEEAKTQAKVLAEENDYIRTQWERLNSLNLTLGEQTELENEARILGHVETIKQVLYESSQSFENELTGINKDLHHVLRKLQSISDVYPNITELVNRLESIYIETKDISTDITSQLHSIDFNPSRMQEVQDRLDSLYDLMRIHHVNTVDDLIALRDKFYCKLKLSNDISEQIYILTKRTDEAKKKVLHTANILSDGRCQAGKKVELKMHELLAHLGIPHAKFSVQINTKEIPDENGIDNVKFLFSANKNTPLQPIEEVASGGETARVMLCLKAMIAGTVGLPTIIFDEIDTGVSGATAQKMGIIMHQMSTAGRQIVSISHLPQIAAQADTHYIVYKDDSGQTSSTHIAQLNQEQRIQEIARMLSGAGITPAAMENAKVLLNI